MLILFVYSCLSHYLHQQKGRLYQIRSEIHILMNNLLYFIKNKEEIAKPRGETLTLAVCSGLYLSHQGLDGLQRPELTSMT